jgi:hypothetical protein
MDTDGYSPGLGNALDAATSDKKQLRFGLCGRDEMGSYKAVTDDFNPLPTHVKAKDQAEWVFPFDKLYAVTGTLTGGPLYKLRDWAPIILTNSLFALLGAIYGAGIEVTDTEKNPRQLPESKRRASSGQVHERAKRQGLPKSAGSSKTRRKRR